MTDTDPAARDKPEPAAAAPPPSEADPAGPEPEDEAAKAADEPAPAAAQSPARKIVLITAGVLLGFYVYDVITDRVTPYTSQAAVDTFLVQIAPEVTGQVDYVGVSDNRAVRKGDVLFRIDREPFEIALRAAEANLAAALQSADVAETEIAVARASLNKQRVDLATSRELGGIINDLADEGALARTAAIRANSDTAKSQADLTRGQAEVERAQRRLGGTGANNVAVRQAMAALDQARLDLRKTTVRAPADGVVTNLRLAVGQYVGTGQPLLSFINSGPRWISADMRENQLGNVAPGNRVLVVLDEEPGSVFEGRVDSIGWGVTQGDEAPTGQLPDVQPATGWLREPQRFPVRILLKPTDEGNKLAAGRSGAQANVMVLTDDASILNPIGWLWIRLVSWLSYLR
ncbi:MAG TPA: HlyD family secretion protein [Croceibacterium sp.]|nr:HlyD family secretion protein [Croceibacterium sp.]